MSDWYDNIYRHATDPGNIIERVKELLGGVKLILF